jgi:hypothetical protein
MALSQRCDEADRAANNDILNDAQQVLTSPRRLGNCGDTELPTFVLSRKNVSAELTKAKWIARYYRQAAFECQLSMMAAIDAAIRCVGDYRSAYHGVCARQRKIGRSWRGSRRYTMDVGSSSHRIPELRD